MTIEECYTDESIIPPVIDQQRGQTKIFQIYFWTLDAIIDTIVSKIFNDDQMVSPLLSPSITTSSDKMTSDPIK